MKFYSDLRLFSFLLRFASSICESFGSLPGSGQGQASIQIAQP